MFDIYRLDIHENPTVWADAPDHAVEIRHILGLILERQNHMATQAQLDKLKTDIAALIQAASDEITAAVAAAQAVPPEKADAALDTLDTQVTDATQKLKDAAAALKLPPPAA